jgi:hypothetical protein
MRWADKSPLRPIVVTLVITVFGVAFVVSPGVWAEPAFPRTTVVVTGWVAAVTFGAVTAILVVAYVRSRR